MRDSRTSDGVVSEQKLRARDGKTGLRSNPSDYAVIGSPVRTKSTIRSRVGS